jgi:hypothetical protein
MDSFMYLPFMKNNYLTNKQMHHKIYQTIKNIRTK